MPAKNPKTGDLESIETASRDELSALQLSRLRWSLQHAYDNVPHYRRALDRAGVVPSDCRSLADLALFPLTTKADLREYTIATVSPMPSYKSLGDGDVADLVAYLLSLKGR